MYPVGAILNIKKRGFVRQRGKILLALFLTVLMAGPVFADGDGARAIVKNELIGSWQNVMIPNDRSINGQYPYQLILFREDGVMKRIQSTKPINEITRKVSESSPSTVHYTLGENGLLTMKWADTAHEEYAMGTYITKDVQNPGQPMLKTGDLILTYIDPSGSVAFKQLLRKEKNSSKLQSPPAEIKPPVKQTPAPESKGFEGADIIILNSGQIFKGQVLERDKNGLWFEMGQGAKVYFSNGEVKSVNNKKLA